MLCSAVTNLKEAEFVNKTANCERYEFEVSQQVVYRIYCCVCGTFHSVETGKEGSGDRPPQDEIALRRELWRLVRKGQTEDDAPSNLRAA